MNGIISSKIIRFLGCALALFVSPPREWAQTTGQRLEIAMCDFKVPPEIARANATFTVVFAVQVGEDGRTTKIEREKNTLLSDEPFITCLKTWIYPVKTNKGLFVSFVWRHGQGWTEVAISGADLDYRIAFQPGAFAQYARTSEASPPHP